MGYAENGDWFSSYSGANIDNLLGCGKINLIDNAYFGYDPFPINQQGQTSYTKTNGDICIDRWKQYSGTVNVTENALSITAPAAGVVMSQELSDGACAICRTYGGCSLSVVGHADHPEKWWVRLSTDGTKLYFPESFPGYTAGCATTAVVSSSSTNNIVLEIGVDNPSGGDFLLLRAIKLEPITSILGASQTLYVIEDSGNGPVAIEKNVPNYDEELVRCTMNEGFTPLVGKGINLLDNAYFIGGGTAGMFPVNQRYPQTVFNLGEKTDRWAVVGFAGTLTLNSGYATLVSTGAFTVARQKIYRPLKVGDVVTISILTDSNCFFATGAFPSESNPLSAVIDGATGTRIQVFMGGDGYPYCDIISVSGVTINIKAVKLELGTQQTLARQVNGSWVLNDPPPDYGQELAKCQRYLQIFRGGGNALVLSAGFMNTGTECRFPVYLSVPMAPIQSVEAAGGFDVDVNGTWSFNASSVLLLNQQDNCAYLRCTLSSAVTQFSLALVALATYDTLILSAE